jgi:CoA:oxalate CoA-transferase
MGGFITAKFIERMTHMTYKPLEGIRVLDMSRVLAGPYCTMMLSNLGAEIIKLEMPGIGDDSRAYGPHIGEESIYFLSINRGKKSIVVDMKSDEGRRIFERLLAESDVLVENFKPGTLKKLGYGYEQLQALNPQIIYTVVSGFGHTGPYAARPAYDMIVQGMGGIMSITGTPDGDPVRVGTSIGDIVAGMFAAYGTLAALFARTVTGQGQMVDVAMLDSQIAILENAVAKTSTLGVAPGPLGLKRPSITPFEAYRTKDSWIIVAAGNDKLFAALCRVVGQEELIEDPRFVTNAQRNTNMHLLSDIMQQHFSKKTTAEWLEILNEAHIPAGPINTIDKLFDDPHVAERNMLVEVEQPGIGKIKVAGNPIKLSHVPPEKEIPEEHAPRLGEHTREVLIQYAGYTPDEAEDYIRRYQC